MRPPAWLFYGLLGVASGLLSAAELSPAMRLRSPHGKVEFTFASPRFDMTVDPDLEKPTEGLKTMHYNVTFYQPGSSIVMATSDFYDIQSSKSQPFPIPVTELAESMIWSPNDDWTVLPLEKWPPEKKKNVHRRAVSMSGDVPWQTKEFLLDEKPLVWKDDQKVVGNARDGCRQSVSEFDARTGKTSALAEAAAPEGYTIVSATDQSILMKKILGPCATAEDTQHFVAECSLLDLRFNRKQIGSCPP